MRKTVLWGFALAASSWSFLLPIWASQPGQPFDCTDWVFLTPGLTCTDIADQGDQCNAQSDWCNVSGSGVALDNTRASLKVRIQDSGDVGNCDGTPQGFLRLTI